MTAGCYVLECGCETDPFTLRNYIMLSCSRRLKTIWLLANIEFLNIDFIEHTICASKSTYFSVFPVTFKHKINLVISFF